MICEYGCEQKANYLLKYKHRQSKWCCSKTFHKCIGWKKKCGEKNLGENNPFYGCTHTKESIKKMLESRGDKQSGSNHHFYGKKRPEFSSWQRNHRDYSFMKGENHHFYGKKRHNQSLRMKEKNPMSNPDVVKRKSMEVKIYWEQLSEKERIERYIKLQPKTNEKGQNKWEEEFDKLTSSNIKWVGNFRKKITLKNGDKKYPDFKVKDQRKLIELFGEYWHPKNDEQKYIEEYGKIGYECLVIWYSDWKENKKTVLETVRRFI